MTRRPGAFKRVCDVDEKSVPLPQPRNKGNTRSGDSQVKYTEQWTRTTSQCHSVS